MRLVDRKASLTVVLLLLLFLGNAAAVENGLKDALYDTGQLKPVDSTLKVAPGQAAPDFTLPAISGKEVTLSSLRGRNVVISFVPAAWTPVCSDQWPGYGISRHFFDDNEAVLLGITVDNIPTLHAWVRQMGNIWFEVLSDFWPHGEVASAYGLLRTDGTSERALVFIDRQGIISDIYVSDINVRPPLEYIVTQLRSMK
ncbi:MAG: redoxin domain-containing protein [Desulfofustis sp.]|jgi:peroxiredoxin